MNSKAPSIEATTLGRLARWCYHHRRQVLAVWVLGLIVINIVAFAVGGGKFEDKFSGGNSESQKASSLLSARFPSRAGDTAEIVFNSTGDAHLQVNAAEIEKINAAVAKLPHVVSVTSPFDPSTGGGQQAGGDRMAFSLVQFDRKAEVLSKKDMKAVVTTAQAGIRPGLDIQLAGAPIERAETAPFGTSEIVGIWAAIFILLVAFGSVIAMGLPIMTALFGIGVGVGVIELASRTMIVPTFGTELAAMIGIGVGIDYALFIVTRYRQGLHDGFEPEEAVVLALATSGRAVLFAGCTVVISLLGMLILGLPFIYGLAVGAIAAVVLVMAGALTLLPAVLGFCGRAIDRLHLPNLHKGTEQRETFAHRWSHLIQRYRWLAAAFSLIVLVALAIPLFSMHLAFTDAGNDPGKFTTRKAYDQLSTGFGPGANGVLVVSANLPVSTDDHIAMDKLSIALNKDPGIAFAGPATYNGALNTALLVAIPKTSPQDQKTQQLVHRIRTQIVPPIMAGTGITAYLGGITAAAVDSSAHISSRLPLVIGGVVILSFLLLMAVFRSIAVPLKAAVMNLLSVGAAYGVIVAVFQWGWLGGFFNIGKTGPIDPWIPLMLFTILFGLSMDYEVFLLSRIREEWMRTQNNADSVADGLAATARVITAAAAIMVCVFGSFVLGDLRILKVFGMGLATAVFVDASLVRMILVPATMELLGPANWWFPSWLDKAVPKLSVEAEMPAPASAMAPSGS